MPAIAPWKTSSLMAGVNGTVAGFTNDAAISVNKTFDPEGFINPGVFRWVDRSGGIAAGFPSLTTSLRKPTKQSRIYKNTMQLIMPRMATTSPSTNTGIEPAPTVAYSNQARLECLIHERATNAERVLFISTLISALFSSINASDGAPSDVTGSPFFPAIVNLDAPY